MFVNVAVVVVLVISVIFILLHQQRKQLCGRVPPDPRPLPIIGNFHQFLYHNSARHRHLWQLSKQFGPLMSLRLGSVPTLVVSSAKMAKEIFKTHDLAFSSRPSLLGLQKLSYNGLDLAFTPYSRYWRHLRKLYTSSFQFQACSLLSSHQATMTSFFFTDYFPVFGKWIDRFRELIWRLEKNFKEMDMFYRDIINDHLNPNRSKPDQDDIIDVSLGIMKEKSFSFELTLDHIKAILMNIFIGATDTSAATIVWAMTGMAKNPRVMDQAQQEIRELYGGKDFINEDDIQRLDYLKAVVKETLRLYSPVPLLIPREATQSCNVNGYEIQPKTLVYLNAWTIGMDPEVWMDPEEFYPGRFLGILEDKIELIPFGAGRSCPRILMGQMTVELTLANLLHLFDWELPVGMAKEVPLCLCTKFHQGF